MKFKIDENLPGEVSAILNENHHESLTILEQSLGGCRDENIIEVCRNEGRVLVTLDQDFSNIRAYPPKSHGGVILLNPITQSKNAIINLVRLILPVLAEQSPQQKLWIVEPARLRMHE